MAKKPTKASVTQLQRDILAQRANLISSEAEVAQEINKTVARLIGKWRAAIKKVLTSTGTASEVADASRYAKILRDLGQATDATVAAVERVATKVYQQTLREESARFAHKFDKAGLKVETGLGIKFDAIASKQLAAAAKYAELPGMSVFKSFAGLSAAAKRRMQQDVVDAIAEGKSGYWLGKKWASGAGAGRLANEADALARTAMMAASNQAMVSEALASGGRIKALRWSAVFDLRTCPTCGGLHGKVFSLTALPAMPAHPRCVLPDTVVLSGRRVAATRAWYRGDVVTVRTKSGRILTVTENHPVLTRRGFIPASRLREGDHLVRYRDGVEQSVTRGIDGDYQPATAREIFELASVNGPLLSGRVPTSPVQFHGDAARFDGDVDVVATHRELGRDHCAAICQNRNGGDFFGRLVRQAPLLALRDFDAMLLGLRLAAYGRVCGVREAEAILSGRVPHTDVHRLASVTLADPDLAEPSNNGAACDAHLLSYGLDRFAAFVHLDEVVGFDRKFYSGHVYDLQTASGAYVADGLIVHNCRCHWEPVFADVDLNTALNEVRPYPKPSPASILGQSRDFDKWLQGQPTGQQLDFFGSRVKQQAWKTGALRLDQMSSPTGRVLSDQEILTKLGKAQAKAVTQGTPLAKSLPPIVQAPPDVAAHAPPEVPTPATLTASSAEPGSLRAKLLDATASEAADIDAAIADLDAYAKSISGYGSNMTEAEFDAAWVKYGNRSKAVLERQRALAERGRALVQTPDPSGPFRLYDPFGDKVTEAKNAKAIEAERFLRSIISKDAGVNIELSVFKLTENTRAFYTDGAIHVSQNQGVSTYVHEMAHAIEQQTGWVAEARRFILSRSKNEALKKLSDLYPDAGYGPNEWAFEDKFRNAYMGRWYAKGEATEIISMGLQWMYEDAVGFARQDPEYFDFITKLIRGKGKSVAVEATGEIALAPATFDVLGRAKKVLAGELDSKTATEGLTDEQAKQLKYKLHNIKQAAKKAGIDPLTYAGQMKNTFVEAKYGKMTASEVDAMNAKTKAINDKFVAKATFEEEVKASAKAFKEAQDLAVTQAKAAAAQQEAIKAKKVANAVEKLEAMADDKVGFQNQFFDIEDKVKANAAIEQFLTAAGETELADPILEVPLSKIVAADISESTSAVKHFINELVYEGQKTIPTLLKYDGKYYLSHIGMGQSVVAAADFLGAGTIEAKVIDLDAWQAGKKTAEAIVKSVPIVEPPKTFLDALGYAKLVLQGVGDVSTVAAGLPKEAIAEIKQKLRIIRRKAKQEGISQLEAAAKMKHGKPFAIGTTPIAEIKPVMPPVPKVNLIPEQPKVELGYKGVLTINTFPKAALPGLEGIEIGSVVDGSSMVKYAEQKGSNPGGFYKAQDGTKWYLKTPGSGGVEKDYEAARNEVLANKLYKAAGVRVAEVDLANIDGKVGVASKIMDLKTGTAAELAKAKGTYEGFAVDAWLANWDVVGLKYDNLLLDSAGNAVRLDTGGALRYRAKTGLKGSLFGNDVNELETFLSAKNPQANAVFSGITDQQIVESINKVAAVTPTQIVDLVNAYGPVGTTDRETLINRLLARRKYLVEKRDELVHRINNPPAPRVAFVAPGSAIKYKSLDQATEKEVEALRHWVSSAGQTSLYQYFENPVAWREKQLLETYGSKAKLEEAVKRNERWMKSMAELIQKLPTVKKPADFARGVRVSDDFMARHVQKWIDDEVLPIEFTQSVSRSKSTANNFGNLIFHFKNTDKMLDLYQVRQDSSISLLHIGEQEVFAVKGTRFKIVKVVKSSGKTELWLEDMP